MLMLLPRSSSILSRKFKSLNFSFFYDSRASSDHADCFFIKNTCLVCIKFAMKTAQFKTTYRTCEVESDLCPREWSLFPGTLARESLKRNSNQNIVVSIFQWIHMYFSIVSLIHWTFSPFQEDTPLLKASFTNNSYSIVKLQVSDRIFRWRDIQRIR